jgi:hypothetical protein
MCGECTQLLENVSNNNTYGWCGSTFRWTASFFSSSYVGQPVCRPCAEKRTRNVDLFARAFQAMGTTVADLYKLATFNPVLREASLDVLGIQKVSQGDPCRKVETFAVYPTWLRVEAI